MDLREVLSYLDLSIAAASLLLAGLVLAVAPHARVNRLLALYLVMASFTTNHDEFMPDPLWAYNMKVLSTGVWMGVPFAYLAFTSHAVDVAWLRPLRHPAARRLLVAAAVLAVPLAFAAHPLIVEPFYSSWIVAPPLASALRLGSGAVVLTALAASLHAFARAAPGTVARRRAAAYALAFGVQDVSLAIGFVFDSLPTWANVVLSLALASSLVLLAIGLLRFQLFDFALRVKFGVQRGTLAAIFLATFFVVAEIAQNYLSDNVGYVAGGLAAGALVFALRPLERLAARVADTAMPRVEATPSYLAYKKLEVYRAAVEAAVEMDGRIDGRERDLLDRLGAKLGLHAGDARAVESDVLGQHARAAEG